MKKSLNHWSFYVVLTWVIISLFAPILASENKWFIGKSTVNSPIPFHPNTIDYDAVLVEPIFLLPSSKDSHNHLLGTDEMGRDVLSQIIYGSRTALIVGFFSMLLAALFGIILGSIAAYYGDRNRKANSLKLSIQTILSLFLISYVVYVIPWQHGNQFNNIISLLIVVAIICMFLFLVRKLTAKFGRDIFLPIDLIIGRLIELFESIPILFLLLSLSTIFKPSVNSVIFCIALVAWPTIAKFCRAEFLKVQNEPFIENAKALGVSNSSIILKHILPNALAPTLITLVFGISAAILLESTLSFLGFGFATNVASWGKVLAGARSNYEAWWLALFPGIMIFITILSLSTLAKRLQKLN